MVGRFDTNREGGGKLDRAVRYYRTATEKAAGAPWGQGWREDLNSQRLTAEIN
jgi:hypothetical protein